MFLALIGLCAFAVAAEPAPPYDPAEARPGGDATAAVEDPESAFARPAGNLPAAARRQFARGADLFYRRWIAGPAPPPALTGLGPLYNALSCQQCHLNDGRGRPPEPGAARAGSLGLKFVPKHAIYGAQLQDRAIDGRKSEGRVEVDWETSAVRIGDGSAIALDSRIESTDLTWADLSLSFLWWRGGEIVGTDRAKGRDCYLVDLPAPAWQPTTSGYHHVRLWIDQSLHMLLRAEGFDADNQPLRSLWVRSLKKTDGRWMIKDMEVQAYPPVQRTRLRIHTVKIRAAS